jgi:hypothetical protein
MKNDLLPIPNFLTEAEEFEFWSTHDTTDYIDWSKAETAIFPNLQPTRDVDDRLKHLLLMREVESLAKKKHTTKEALISQFIADGINKENSSLGY